MNARSASAALRFSLLAVAACGGGTTTDAGTDSGRDAGASLDAPASDAPAADAPATDAPAADTGPIDAGTDGGPAPGAVGAPCAMDSDCHGTAGRTAFCYLSQPRPEFPVVPNGYCAEPCGPQPDGGTTFDPSRCPSTEGCTFVPMHGPTCMLRCTSDADCREAEGYQCAVNTFAGGDTQRVCLPPLDLTGGACMPSSSDCGHENVDGGMQECLVGDETSSLAPFTGGYCSSTCGPFGSTCGAHSACLPLPMHGPRCYRSCAHDTDCRTGYTCGVLPFLGTIDGGTVCIPADGGVDGG